MRTQKNHVHRSGLPAIASALALLLVGITGCERSSPPANDPAGDSPAPASSPSPEAALPAPNPAAPTKASSGREVTPGDVERITVEDARRRVQAGESLLVLAYTGEDRFQRQALDGAISYENFEERVPTLPLDQEIIFY